VTDLEKEMAAYGLLQWVPYSLPTFFDEQLAADCFYTKMQRQRSNAALAIWDDEHPEKSSAELAAFRQLNDLNVYSDNIFYSPSRAKDGGYTKRLKEHLSSGDSQRSQSTFRPDRPARWRSAK